MANSTFSLEEQLFGPAGGESRPGDVTFPIGVASTLPVEGDFTSLMGESLLLLGDDVTPLSGNDVTPLSGNGFPPLSGNDVTPLSGNGFPPLSGNDVTPLSGNDVTPLSGNGFPPLSGNNVTPLSGNGFPPLSGNDVTPLSGNGFPPLSGNEFSGPIGANTTSPMENKFHPHIGHQLPTGNSARTADSVHEVTDLAKNKKAQEPLPLPVKSYAGEGVIQTLLEPWFDFQRPLIFLVHGDYHTSNVWLQKPNGRPGWAVYFQRRGFQVIVPDLPGNRAYPLQPADKRFWYPVNDHIIRDEVVAPERTKCLSWHTARLHNQWCHNNFQDGGNAFQRYLAMTSDMYMSSPNRQAAGQHALVSLLKAHQRPAILIGEGSGATVSWLAADKVPHLVAGVVAVEPYGPPGGSAKARFPNGKLVGNGRHVGPIIHPDAGKRRYGIADVPLTFEPPVPDAMQGPDGPGGNMPAPLNLVRTHMDAHKGIYLLQRDGNLSQMGPGGEKLPDTDADVPRRLPQLMKVGRHLVVTAEASSHSQHDGATVAFLEQAGVQVDWMRLEDYGLFGNGHLMWMEENSKQIADCILWWLSAAVDGVVSSG